MYYHAADASYIFSGQPASAVQFACFIEKISWLHQYSIPDHSIDKNYLPKAKAMGKFANQGNSRSRMVARF